MKIPHFVHRRVCAGLIMFVLCVAGLTGCGDSAKKASGPEQPGTSGPYWLIEVSDTKTFSYAVPNGSGEAIDMTATLYFIAWKEGGEEMFGQYEGRALVALDMDFSQAGSGGVSFTGGAMDDSISDNITFEMLPAQEEAVTAVGEDIDLAPLVQTVGQADIMTEDYMITQQNWKALADGEVKLDVNGGFGDGERYPQGYDLKAGQDSVLVSVRDLAAAHNLEAFSGTIIKTDTPPDAISRFRDKMMTRMEERVSYSEQSAGQQTPGSDPGSTPQSGWTVDSEGREGMDTNGDGRFEIYIGEDGHAWADFDGDGKYDIVGEEGSDH